MALSPFKDPSTECAWDRYKETNTKDKSVGCVQIHQAQNKAGQSTVKPGYLYEKDWHVQTALVHKRIGGRVRGVRVEVSY